MKGPSAPVVIMSGGVRQGIIGYEVNEIDFDEVEALTGKACVLYCAHALSYLAVDEAAEITGELLARLETELAGL
jgi:hypothetical protein